MPGILSILTVVVGTVAAVVFILAMVPFVAATFEVRYTAYCDWAEAKVKEWRQQ